MTFTESSFAGFFCVVYGLWLVCRRDDRLALPLLLGASLVFYGHDDWRLVWLLLACGLVDWTVGLWLARTRRPRIAVAVGVGFNLGLLTFWKYTPLLWQTFMPASSLVTFDGWTLPFGISFYAFTGIAYLIDVYRRSTPAERSPLRLLLFISFFPHLVAGPILRAREFLSDLRSGSMPQRSPSPREAVFLVGRGYFKKMVIADRIGPAIDPFFAHVADPATAGVWSLPYLYLYAFQIYFDFSGYTDIARGLALLFGFRWPENFRAPYLAASPREFWRRWHITLSLFLRDYLYIPLGGNRHGQWRSACSLMITMLLGGLWHGGSWSFLLWGGIHGTLLVLHRAWELTGVRRWLVGGSASGSFLWHVTAIFLTFNAVCLAWSFFRLTTLRESLACLGKVVAFDPKRMLVGAAGDPALWVLLASYATAALLSAAWQRSTERGSRLDLRLLPLRSGFAWGLAGGLLLLAFVLSTSGERQPFIYFQF